MTMWLILLVITEVMNFIIIMLLHFLSSQRHTYDKTNILSNANQRIFEAQNGSKISLLSR